MKIKVTSPIVWNGNHTEAGSVLDVSSTDAHNLIGRGRAVPYSEAKEETKIDRSVGLETSSAPADVVKRSYKRKPSSKT